MTLFIGGEYHISFFFLMATNTLACVVVRGMVISLENISQIQSISVTFRYNRLLED